MTPYVCLLLAGSLIPINDTALLLDILIIVLIPMALGLVIRMVASGFVNRVYEIIPLVSVLSIIAIILSLLL
ncbi:MAG: hypothetical protein ACRDBM_04705 [Sporomusa sp.]